MLRRAREGTRVRRYSSSEVGAGNVPPPLDVSEASSHFGSDRYTAPCTPSSTKPLFQKFFVVGIDPSRQNEPALYVTHRRDIKILWSFTPEGSESLNVAVESQLKMFCFPESEKELQNLIKTRGGNDMFTFVLTEDSGARMFGFCLRILPVGLGSRHDVSRRFPECLCICSRQPDFELFSSLLPLLAFGRWRNDRALKAAVRALNVPHPPEVARTFNYFRHILYRPAADERAKPSLSRLLNSLSLENLLLLVSATLSERRILMISKRMQSASECIHHIFLPIVPHHLIHVIMSPTPFLAGMTRAQLQSLREEELPIGDFVLVDVDTGILSVESDSPSGGRPILPIGEPGGTVLSTIAKHGEFGCVRLRRELHTLYYQGKGFKAVIERGEGELPSRFARSSIVKTGLQMASAVERRQKKSVDIASKGRQKDKLEVDVTAFANSQPDDGVRRLIFSMHGSLLLQRFAHIEAALTGKCTPRGGLKSKSNVQHSSQNDIDNRHPVVPLRRNGKIRSRSNSLKCIQPVSLREEKWIIDDESSTVHHCRNSNTKNTNRMKNVEGEDLVLMKHRMFLKDYLCAKAAYKTSLSWSQTKKEVSAVLAVSERRRRQSKGKSIDEDFILKQSLFAQHDARKNQDDAARAICNVCLLLTSNTKISKKDGIDGYERKKSFLLLCRSATYSSVLHPLLWRVLDDRLKDCQESNWRHGAKALDVIIVLLSYGSPRLVADVMFRRHILIHLMRKHKHPAVRYNAKKLYCLCNCHQVLEWVRAQKLYDNLIQPRRIKTLHGKPSYLCKFETLHYAIGKTLQENISNTRVNTKIIISKIDKQRNVRKERMYRIQNNTQKKKTHSSDTQKKKTYSSETRLNNNKDSSDTGSISSGSGTGSLQTSSEDNKLLDFEFTTTDTMDKKTSLNSMKSMKNNLPSNDDLDEILGLV